eukprot:scaffold45122_cov25-Tisochrysis_lutea.AAC.1
MQVARSSTHHHTPRDCAAGKVVLQPSSRQALMQLSGHLQTMTSQKIYQKKQAWSNGGKGERKCTGHPPQVVTQKQSVGGGCWYEELEPALGPAVASAAAALAPAPSSLHYNMHVRCEVLHGAAKDTEAKIVAPSKSRKKGLRLHKQHQKQGITNLGCLPSSARPCAGFHHSWLQLGWAKQADAYGTSGRNDATGQQVVHCAKGLAPLPHVLTCMRHEESQCG